MNKPEYSFSSEPKFINVSCAEVQATDAHVREIANKLLDRTAYSLLDKNKCTCLTANMFNCDLRIAVIDSLFFNQYVKIANLRIIETQGDPIEYLQKLITHPKKYIRMGLHSKINVDFDNIETGEPVNQWLKYPESYTWGACSFLMDGLPLDVVDRSFRTIKNNEMRINRNERCPCKSGLKYKKCCGDLT